MGRREVPVLLAGAAVLLGGLTAMLLLGAAAMLRSARHDRQATIAPAPRPVVMAGGAVRPVPCTRAVGDRTSSGPASRGRILTLATAVGLVTGFFGVGAGFVVVPALVSAMRLPVKRATALVVIVINSATALVVRHGDLGPPAHTAVLVAATAGFPAGCCRLPSGR